MFISRRRRQPTSTLEPALVDFFAAAPVTDQTQKDAVTVAYRALVAAGEYSKLLRWYPCVGANLSASLMDFVTLTRATAPTPPTYDPNSGWEFTGTEWIQTGFTPSVDGGTTWIAGAGSLAVDIFQLNTDGYFAGGQNGTSMSYLLYDSGLSGVYGAINVVAVSGYSACGFAMGVYSICRTAATTTHLYFNGSEVLLDTTLPSAAASNMEIYIGANNVFGLGAQDNCGAIIVGARMGGLTNPVLVDPIILTMNASLGRNLS